MKRYDTLDDQLAFKRGCDLKPEKFPYVQLATETYHYADGHRSTKY